MDNKNKIYRFENNFNVGEIEFYNIKNDPFDVYGLYNYKDGDIYRRMPAETAKATSEAVSNLSLHTAGGRIRFATDSPFIVIKAVLPKVTRFSHMPLSGTTGMDIYVDQTIGSVYHSCIKPDVNITDGYMEIVKFNSQKLRYITINMPLFNPVNEIFIGIAENSVLRKGNSYINKKPVVYYGSSITHGACASRPGLCYENIISRRLNLDYINLGFSGNAKAEVAIAEYMASLDMLAFVCDYDHNSPNVQHLRDTHYRLYEIIRKSKPDIPYIMITRPDTIGKEEDAYNRREVIHESYLRAKEEGDNNVYFIDGEGFFLGHEPDNCTVDGTHPNDIGFLKMADSIGKVLEKILNEIDLGGDGK